MIACKLREEVAIWCEVKIIYSYGEKSVVRDIVLGVIRIT